jgi:hypothetical protein
VLPFSVTVLPAVYAVDAFQGWHCAAWLAAGASEAAVAMAADRIVSRSSLARRSGVHEGEGISGDSLLVIGARRRGGVDAQDSPGVSGRLSEKTSTEPVTNHRCLLRM